MRSSLGGPHDSVAADVCRACCDWPLPETDHLNPVVASLILDRSDAAGADPVVRRHALAALPIIDDTPLEPPPPRNRVVDASVTDLRRVLPLPDRDARDAMDGDVREPPAEVRWSLAVMTSPRRRPTIDDGLRSLAAAGWDRVAVHQDGGNRPTIVADDVDLTATVAHRRRRIGAWPSFVAAMCDSMHRSGDADGHLVIQDDGLLTRCPAVRPYLNQCLRRIGPNSIATLYTASVDATGPPRWRRWDRPYLHGAVAILFGRDAASRFVDDIGSDPWRFCDPDSRRRRERRGIDGHVGRWARQRGVPVWSATRSLVWHLGDTSTMWPGSAQVGIRRAGRFVENELARGAATGAGRPNHA